MFNVCPSIHRDRDNLSLQINSLVHQNENLELFIFEDQLVRVAFFIANSLVFGLIDDILLFYYYHP